MQGYTANIAEATKANVAFRRVLYTGQHIQLVLMSLAGGEEIGLETHEGNDQFFRFETGEGKCIVDDKEYVVGDDIAVIVPAGAKHNIINTSATNPLRFYTLYGPAHHQDKIVRATKQEAESDAPDFDGITTE